MKLILFWVLVLFATAVFAVVARAWSARSRYVYGICLITSLAVLGLGLQHLLSNSAPETLVLPIGLPWLGAHFHFDALAAFFLIVINLGGAAASVYAFGYGKHEAAPERVLAFYAAFLATMNLVILAADAFTFLLCWEFMSLSSWALVLVQHRERDNTRAGYIYLLMAGFGTLTLLLVFGLLDQGNGQYAFTTLREAPLETGAAALVLTLTLIGAGSKAGLTPLHVWLPLAHPAAPSHVSALMSGVMTKVAVYAFIRIVFDLLNQPLWWGAMMVLIVGGVSAALGILYALMQRDLKRLLAYSTVENIGIIFVGLGLALAFQVNGFTAGAGLALTAALFHVLNHSLFKSLLFFGAGAVLTATGERNMENLGGLIQRMPYTSFVFLLGAMAISALPPLNGFVSEWLMFQTILLSPELPQWGLKLAVPAVGALLALAAALAATCFVKAFGITFLGRARSDAASAAHEVDRWMLAPMFVLAVLCLLAGILPVLVIDALAPVVAQLNGGAHLATQSDVGWLSLVPLDSQRSSYNGLLVMLFMFVSGGLSAYVVHRRASHKLRRSDPWDCGFPNASPVTQYSASSFAQPVRRVFGSVVFQARETVNMPAPGDLKAAKIEVKLRDPVWEILFSPLLGIINAVTSLLNRFQFLTIRRYLTLVFGALILLLAGLAIWQ